MIPKSVRLGHGPPPESPGVYLMKNDRGEILYIGKAGNLRRRVESYFNRPAQFRIEQLLREVRRIDFKKTDTAIEALILESALIKKHQPPFNVREKDDKSFLYVEITREKFPRVLLARGKDLENDRVKSQKLKIKSYYFGPFTSAGSLREALRIIRRIFPWNTHPENQMANSKWRVARGRGRIAPRNIPQAERARSDPPAGGKTDRPREKKIRPREPDYSGSEEYPAEGTASRRPCFEYEIGLCPGVCAGVIMPVEYRKTVRNIVLFLNGKKKQIVKNLEREMKSASKRLDFEKAAEFRRQLFALQHIQDVALIGDSLITSGQSLVPARRSLGESGASGSYRIEGYDISNISGSSAVGAMVVFSSKGGSAPGGENFEPNKDEYRKFRIKTVVGSNDVAMIREVLTRRFQNPWPHPKLILIDGGKPQVNAAREVLANVGAKIPVVGIAKGPRRKKNEFHGAVPRWIEPHTLIYVRDEAHRSAVSYHRRLRSRNALKN